MQHENCLDAALSYASIGLPVFPVRGKRPVTPGGFKDASVSEKHIRAWFETEGNNYGVAIAIPSWIIIVDIDGPAGIGALESHGFSLPATVTSRSKKGKHFWYRVPDGFEAKRKIRVLPEVDLLVNGYVVVPPSKHPQGGQYEWVTPFTPGNLAEAPDWILTIAKQEDARSNKVNPEEFLKGLPDGQRQTGLFRYACELRGRPKMTSAEAKVLVRQVALMSGSERYKTDELVDRVWKQYDQAKERDEDVIREVKVWTMADLAAMHFEAPKRIVQDILPSTGYTLLTSPPKRGKSSVAAYACACITSGKDLWGLRTNQTGVLYLDLEQDEADAFGRWRGHLRGAGVAGWPANLHTAFTWPVIDDGGLEKIGEFLVSHPHVGLVVIDTLADMWPEQEGSQSNAYHREQRVVRKFGPISRDLGVAFLVVHHDRKGTGDDFIQRASGTYAITGKAQAIWSFQRDSFSDTATLEITGKNVMDNKINLILDRENFVWDRARVPVADEDQ